MTPTEILLDPTFGPWLQLAAIFLATFVSEDVTCVSVGLLIHAGKLSPWLGVVGCLAGIFVGDLGLWALGRVAGAAAGRWWQGERLRALAEWLERRGWLAVLAARFLPGTRLPLYVAAGVAGVSARRFVLWTALAAILWTPTLVLVVALLGDAVVAPIQYLVGDGWPASLIAVATACAAVRVLTLAATPAGRGRLVASASRAWRWEFWPSWLFYLPLLPWLAYLSLRYRGALVWTAANPGIPQGGVVGESKSDILRQLPGDSVVPGFLVPAGDVAARVALVRERLATDGVRFPLILKPDAAQRGEGVKQARGLDDVERYFLAQPAAVIVQAYHPGPFEAGVFYYRLPGEERGHVFSITDKEFPVVTGDGVTTLEGLIWRHPRYRMQADVFLSRHEAQRDRVPRAGEAVPLALAGNHCQGTTFRDGARLMTPELERAIDAIAKGFAGFYVGRFDVRYSDVAAFKAGRGLGIVELNGVTSESTNLYDPSWTLLAAYRTLFRQWELLYRIGHANARQGHAPASARTLLRLWREYRGRRVDRVAD